MIDVRGLFPHQASHVPWLLERPKALLAWEPGVGKTAPLLRAWEVSREMGPALVICLATARENWRREIRKFALDPHRPPLTQIITTDHEYRTVDRQTDVAIVNYDKLLNERTANDLCQVRWGVIILDEAHALKTIDAKRTMRFYGNPRKKSLRPLVRSSDRIWLATGTPMPNHPGELYSHCRHLWPEHMQYSGHLMEQWEFEAAFCEMQMTPYGVSVIGGRNLRELKARLAPVVSVIKRKEVLDLPPVIIETWALTGQGTVLPPARPNIPGLLGTLQERYGSISDIDRFDAATLDAYLACIESAMLPMPSIRRETAQLKAIYTGLLIAEEIDEDAKKVVVFAHHREALTTLATILARFKPAIIHGDVPQGRRQAQIDRFQNDPKCKVFIGQITAAGASINLQAASKVIFVEASWVPGENEQAYARVYRMGQDKSVWVRFVYLPDSIDEAVSRALARKVVMIEGVFGKMESKVS
jgi:hypothetical protein